MAPHRGAGRRLLNRAADTTGLVDRLVRSGLAERRTGEADRRVVLVRPPRPGGAVERLAPRLRAFHRDQRAVLTTGAGARRLGGAARGLAPWDVTRLETPDRPSIEVTATPCRHGPPGSRPIVGDVVGFALRWDGQEHGALWISGDTVLYGGLLSVADRVDVGTALLHLGGVRFPVTGPVR